MQPQCSPPKMAQSVSSTKMALDHSYLQKSNMAMMTTIFSRKKKNLIEKNFEALELVEKLERSLAKGGRKRSQIV